MLRIVHIYKAAAVLSAAAFYFTVMLFPAPLMGQGFSPEKDMGVNYARQKEVTDRFIVPIESYNGFSGTYGELRGDHFHCGLDMRTNGVVGRKIYAAEDGYVSRITVSPWGYGNMIMLTHPSGYKTIYGHLLRFAPKYSKLVIDKQYEEENWRQYIDFPPDSLPVKRGDLIAYSGNTGSSGGPHLHFEVLDENGVPVNLQITGIYNLRDTDPPAIREIRLVGSTPFYGTHYTFPVKLAGDTVKVPKSFYVAIDAYDVMAGTPGKLAVYQYEAFIDGNSFFRFTEGNIPTSTGRYIASLTDHKLRRATGRYFVKTMIEPANKLQDRIMAVNDGIITLQDSAVHTITVAVTDVYGNKTTRNFKVVRDDSSFGFSVPFSPEGEFAAWDMENRFSYGGLTLVIPNGALYSNSFVKSYRIKESYTAQSNLPAMSGLWKVGDADIPLHQPATVAIKANIPVEYRGKAIVAMVASDGSLSSCGGTYNAFSGEMCANVASFGTFCVTADIIPPEITLKLAEGAVVKGTSIKATVRDRLSGLKSFRAEIDGHWVVAALDGKTSTLEIPLEDARISKGRKHKLVLTAEDNVGNRQTISRSFTW